MNAQRTRVITMWAVQTAVLALITLVFWLEWPDGRLQVVPFVAVFWVSMTAIYAHFAFCENGHLEEGP